LFVDDNDEILDLTLLPEYDKSPYLSHLYGLVRVSGLRAILEGKLEAEEAEAGFAPNRRGFDRKRLITPQLFKLVERHVRPFYDAEEKAQKKGSPQRSENLDKRVKEALKALNQFNADETDETGQVDRTNPSKEPIYFEVDSARLRVGQPRHVR